MTIPSLLPLALLLVLAQDAKDRLKLSAEEQQVLDLTNAERKREGLPPLALSPKLLEAARGHSRNMAQQNRLDHDLGGKTLADRLRDVAYEFQAAAENIASPQKTPQDALRSWLNSAGHRANLLSRAYTEIGVGVARNAQGQPYWTQVFGTPAGK